MPKQDAAAAAQIAEKIKATYAKLQEIRKSKTVSLKEKASRLRAEIVGFGGKLEPLRLRYYQVQGVAHLLMMKRMVLGDGTGLGKCVTGDTLLTTDQGLMPIWELAPHGELSEDTFYEPRLSVRVWDGQEMASVRRFYWNGTVPTLKLTTRNGYQIEGSFTHPLRVRTPDGEDFKKLPNIEVAEDYACIARGRAPFPDSEPSLPIPSSLHPNAKQFTYLPYLTPNLARLLGYIVAEAWTNGKYATNITQHMDVNPEAHADIRRLLLDVFGWEGNDGNANADKLISVNSIGIRQYLEACGLTYTTSRFKEVPWCILRASELSAREFLRGLFEGEGSVSTGGVEFTSASEKLARGVQLLLLRFGIVSTLAPKRVEGYDHTYWRLTFFGEDARAFADDIGFVSNRKNDALDASLTATNNPNKDVVPYLGVVVADLKDALLAATSKTGSNAERAGSGLKQYGESFQSTLKHVIHGKRNATYRFLRQLLEIASGLGLETHAAARQIAEVVRTHYFYDPVVRIEQGRAPVMDIEIDHPKHCFAGNGLINHNTVEVIAFLAYVWDKVEGKAIVVSPKSALRQWEGEILRFTTGVKPFVVSGGPQQRKAVYEAWHAHPVGPGHDRAVLILNYHSLKKDWGAESFQPLLPNGQPDPKTPRTPGLLDRFTSNQQNLITIFDEATAFKTPGTKTWEVCRFLSDRSDRCYGLTATLLKNNLIEGFGIYKVIHPSVFSTKTRFLNDFCVTKLQRVGMNRQVPIIVGYKNLQGFRDTIDPYFLGRPKHVVSDELPKLITKEVVCELTAAEDQKYREALSGVLELGDGTVKDYEEHKAFVALTYCQQVVDSLTLLKYGGGESLDTGMFFDETVEVENIGSKEQALLDLFDEELEGEKTIVYTRFASLVPRLQKIVADKGIKSVAITGAIVDTEKNPRRRQAQQAFQDPDSDVKVIFITDAGSEAINLQAAAAMVFFDAPWSWGNYVQLLGRPIRIGSPHQNVIAIHLVAERPREKSKDRKTIDHYTLALLQKKKDLIDKVLGESAVGALDFSGDSFTKELVRSLKDTP